MHNTLFYVKILGTFKQKRCGLSVKTINKIIIFKKDGKPFSGFVIYSNAEFQEFSYKKLVKEIIKFSNQEECTIDDLYQNKKITVYKDYKKHKSIKKILNDYSDFSFSKKLLDLFSPFIILNSILLFIFTNFIYIGNAMIDACYTALTSYFISAFSIPTLKANKIGKKYNIKGIKKYGFITIFSLIMSFSSLYQKYFPSLKTIPYYFELTHTDIEDTGYYEDLSEEEKHLKACETVFRNIKFNPYLEDDELEALKSLEPFVLNNPYLDMSDVLQKFMTIDVKEKYNLNERDGAMYFPPANRVYYFYNTWDGEKESALIHEYLHSIGSLNNKVLNEGMTSLLAGDIQKCDNMYYDGYILQRYCMQYVISIVGSDLALEAYSKSDTSIIDNELALKFGSMEAVEEFYSLLEKSCYVEFNEQAISQFILNHLNEEDKKTYFENGIYNPDFEYFSVYKRRYDFSDQRRLIKKSY